jgi:hypothetical protein
MQKQHFGFTTLEYDRTSVKPGPLPAGLEASKLPDRPADVVPKRAGSGSPLRKQ